MPHSEHRRPNKGLLCLFVGDFLSNYSLIEPRILVGLKGVFKPTEHSDFSKQLFRGLEFDTVGKHLVFHIALFKT